MTPKVSIIMGSTSDLPVMEKAAEVLNNFCIPFEMNALSAHRTPAEVEDFAKNAAERGINRRAGCASRPGAGAERGLAGFWLCNALDVKSGERG